MEKILTITIVTSILILNLNLTLSGKYPDGLHDNETTTCEEFSRYARFNPYSVLSDEWMAFYYWGPPQIPMFVKFKVPRAVDLAYLKYILEGHVLEPVNWTAKSVLMIDRKNNTSFLVEKNDRGHYTLYAPVKGLQEGDIVEAIDVRLKQTGDNRYFGLMGCENHVVFIFARVKDVPKQKNIQTEAARLGYKGRGGKSYLYQGHQWMPIPEADDEHFDHVINNRHKRLYVSRKKD